MYHYYYIKTDCRSDTWNTAGIQDYLRSFVLFEEKTNGIFSSSNPFLNISLMKVKDLNCWSCLDFDINETNYISIITSEWSDNDTDVQNILKGLEQLSGFRICCDD